MPIAPARWRIRCLVVILLLLQPSIRVGSTWDSSAVQAQPVPRKWDTMERLQIERIGGIAGFGGPHLKSRGEVRLAELSPADRQAVESLFADPQHVMPAHPGEADAFRYHPMIPRSSSRGRLMRLQLASILAGFAVLASLGAAHADKPQDKLAAQVRLQGFACDKAQGAIRDTKRSRPDYAVWTLKCSNAVYRVSRAPDMAAKVQVLR